MRFDWLVTHWSLLLRGLGTTLAMFACALVMGFAGALLVGIARTVRVWWLDWPARAFISLIRGTPLLVQLYLLYFGVGSLLASAPWLRDSVMWPVLREGFFYAVLALALSTAGYGGEIVRVALAAVPKGELEAGTAFGMSRIMLFRRVWLPRALGSSLPTIAGESVMLLKSTALASWVAVVDLLGAANYVRGQTYLVYEPLLVVAVAYGLLTIGIEQTFAWLERRARRGERR